MADDAVYGTLLGGGCFAEFLGDDPAALAYVPVDRQIAEGKALLDEPVDILMGVIDSGVNTRHPQIAAVLQEARAFAGDDPEDRVGHGTAVAIAAMNAGGRLLSARVTDETDRPRLDAVLAALDWLGESGAKVVNMSLGFDPSGPGAARLCAAVARWAAEGVLVVAAAGNAGPDAPKPVPAGCDGAIAVASDEASSGLGDVVAPRAQRMGYAGFLYQRGLDHAQAGRIDAAQADLAALSSCAATGRDHARTAHLAVVLNAIALAFEAFGRQAQADPADPEPRYNRAALLFQARHLPEAAGELAAVLALSPAHADALWLQALVRGYSDDREGALASLDALLAVRADHPHAAAVRAVIAEAAGPVPAALQGHFEAQV